MRKFLLATATLAALIAPLAAQAYPGEIHDDRREVHQDRREVQSDRANGDRREFHEDRRELREDRGELREDRHDRRWDGDHDRRWDGDHDRGRVGYDGRRYDAGRYYHPHGYNYRVWGVGAFLPRPYWGGSYLIGSPGLYGLGYARPNAHWVRVGPDALLIRNGDGAVVEVVRNRFY